MVERQDETISKAWKLIPIQTTENVHRNVISLIQSFTTCEILTSYLTDIHQQNSRDNVARLINVLHGISDRKQKFESCIDTDILIKLGKLIYSYGSVPDFKDKDYPVFEEQELCEIRERSVLSLTCALVLLRSLANSVDGEQPFDLCVSCYLLASQHGTKQEWNTDECVTLSSNIVSSIRSLTTDSFELLSVKMLEHLKTELTKQLWKRNVSSKYNFKFALGHISVEDTSSHIDFIFATSLLFIDDFEIDNKIFGVTCLSMLIERCSNAELSWYGRADVIYDCLEHQLYTRETGLLRVVLPCVLSILQIVESLPRASKHKSRLETNKYDTIFQRVLTDMEMEDKLVNRRLYAQFLPQFIEMLGVTVVKHYPRLFRVVFSYLDIQDGENEEARLLILDALATVIKTSWSRIPSKSKDILKALLKLLYDVNEDSSYMANANVLPILISKIKGCLLLLLEVDQEFVSSCLESTDDAIFSNSSNMISDLLVKAT